MQESTRKSESIMLMNVISMLAVVYLHSNNCFWTFSTDRYWKSANIIEAGLYFAVPCFFMITGANLLDYRQRYDTKTFLIKRAKKTVFPYAIRKRRKVTEWRNEKRQNVLLETDRMKKKY